MLGANSFKLCFGEEPSAESLIDSLTQQIGSDAVDGAVEDGP
jgi:hypothetical protein